MKKLGLFIIVAAVAVIMLLAFRQVDSSETATGSKIDGVSFVAPRRPVGEEVLSPIKKVNANWIALTPYAFAQAGEADVRFNHRGQHWGERQDGIIANIKHAHDLGLKVMIKPHVWVRGQGWAGDFELATEEQWRQWESNYKKYIISYATLADSMQAEMLCIGTEYKKAANARPAFWRSLIKEVRAVYRGKLTYAANWDNYENISFWDDLDYIGIDAYFPLSDAKMPRLSLLKDQWKPVKKQLREYASKHNKPILFTEFGYESADFTAAGHWNYERGERGLNLQAQANGYQALFETFWDEPWFAGGFLWKWFDRHDQSGGPSDKRFTPQNKPAEETIRKWYGREAANQ